VNFGLVFRGAIVFHNGYLAQFLSEHNEVVWGLVNENLFAEFREFGRFPVMPCGDTHQSFIDTTVMWFFDNFPVFADSFSVLSIHRFAQGLCASCCTSAPHRALVPCDSTAFFS